mgnify:CR=1 FL=1
MKKKNNAQVKIINRLNELSILIAKHNLELTRKKKQKLELRVRLLHPENLDPDMLEERVRIMLNYGYPNEFIILDSKNIQSLDPKKLRPQN